MLRMKSWLVILPVLAATWLSQPAQGQEGQDSKVDLYGGYDYVHYTASPRINGVPPSESENANGLSGQIQYNISNRLGAVAELSGYALSRQGSATTYQVSYLFGPRVNLRQGRVTPFAQALFGGFWVADGVTLGSASAFGTTMGGGIDIRVSKHIALRPAQAEYFLTKLPDGNTNRQNNFRYGAGVMLRLGGK